VDGKSRKAEFLATEQNKKVKGEFEIIDPIYAQMEAIVQETHHNVIKTRWYIIAEAHKIVDMSMHVKRFVAKEFSYLLDNATTNYTTVEEVSDDNDNEMQLTD
jgi:hypothetical protein